MARFSYQNGSFRFLRLLRPIVVERSSDLRIIPSFYNDYLLPAESIGTNFVT